MMLRGIVKRWLGLTSLVGLLVSVTVHSASIAGMDVASRFPGVWLLHFLALVICAAVAFFSSVIHRPAGTSVLHVEAYPRSSPQGWPLWGTPVIAVAIGYAIVTFALREHVSGSGVPAIVGGQYVLQSHGRLLTNLTESDYRLHRAYELRAFSAVWIVFYLAPAIYFLSPSLARLPKAG